MLDHRMSYRKERVIGASENRGYSTLALDREIGQHKRVQRSSQISCRMLSVSETDLEFGEHERVQRSPQIPSSNLDHEIDKTSECSDLLRSDAYLNL